MLASITPLGERGRNGHWTITVTAFAIGALGAAALLGALLGAAGSLLVGGLSIGVRLAALAGALLIAVALDAGADRIPGPRRQVDERWLHRYRGWVYGLGYGAQLGAGVATVVTSAATYVAILAAFVCADPLRGALVLGGYGAIRGFTPLVTASVRTPAALMSFHARFQRAGLLASRAGTALLAAGVVVAVAMTASVT